MAENDRTTVKWTDSDRALAFLIVKYHCTKLGNKFSAKDAREVSISRKFLRTADSWNLKIQNYTHAAELLAGRHVNKPHVGGCIKPDPDSPLKWRGEYVEVAEMAESDERSFIELALSEWSNNESAAEIYGSFAKPIGASYVTDFKLVQEGHVTKALVNHDNGNRLEGFSESTTYDLLYNNLRYPPKLIMGMAYKLATGETITGAMLVGGINTPCFKRLEELGFMIVPKIKTDFKFMQINQRLAGACSAKPFTILAGGTGTGKTRSAKLAASSIAGNANVEVVAVGADWTDNRPLLGFRNLLAEGGKTYVAPHALRIILKAIDNPAKPHFLILDEMNLSHVERYFADFLSSMESKEQLKLHDSTENLKTEDGITVPSKIAYPNNLFVIGTVNIDETTYMFSPKVLDRAHVIEFKVTWDEIANGLDGAVPSELPALRPEQVEEFMRVSQLREKALPEDDHEQLTEVLEDLHAALEGTRFVFAHRTARECLNFIASAKALAKADIVEPRNIIDLIDLAILQKALPKLNGASGTLSKVLEELIKVSDKHDLELCKKKLESMGRQLKADQFVSFIQ
jgi:hypothetical protein